MQDNDPAAIGDRGWALLHQAFEDGNPAGFAAAADLLREALGSGPGHPDEPLWHHGLALAMGATADTTGDADHWDAALGEFRRVWAQPPPGLKRDALAGDISYVLVQRFAAGGDHGRHAVDSLVTDLDALHDPAGPAVPTLDMRRGHARLLRYNALAEAADRDQGLALLSAALPDVPEDTSMVAETWMALAAFAADDEKTSGLALDAASHARRLMDPDEQWPDLDDLESGLLYARWLSSDDKYVLDETIERLERLCTAASTPPPAALMGCGEIRLWRAKETDSITDLDAAVRWLEQAEPVVERVDAAALAFLLGTARMQCAQLTGNVAERERALTGLGWALAQGLPTPELELEARGQRLEALLLDMFGDLSADTATATVRGDLAEGLAALDRLPGARADRRATLALTLARAELALAGRVDGAGQAQEIAGLLDIATGHPAAPDGWHELIGLYRSSFQYFADSSGGIDGYVVRSRLMEMLEKTPNPEIAGPPLRQAIGRYSLLAGLQSGDIGDQQAASTLLDDGGDAADAFMGSVARLVRLPGDEQLAAIDQVIAAAPDTGSWDDRFIREYVLPSLQAIQALASPSSGELPELAARTIMGPVMALLAAVIDIVRSAAELAAAPDPHQQVQSLADIAQQTRALPQGSLERILAADIVFTLWLRRAERSKDPQDIAQAISWSGEVIDSLSGPEHHMWIRSAMNAAKAHRLRGTADDRDRSRELGQDVLRGQAWRVLLQSGTEHAITMARTASADAVRVARWCLHDCDYEGLVAALDAGRGLVLHAAVTTRGVAEQLRSAGETGLAQEWADAGGADRIALAGAPDVDLHGDLRRRVLKALGAGRSPLLNPPSIERIREALVTGDADALIYLLPAGDAKPGLAVMVPAREPVEVIELPHLDAGAAAELADHALPGASRDIESVDPSPRPEQPADLTNWAWRVAGYKLGDTAGRLRRADGELPRLLLVPFGALARVPWHAAGLLTELAVVSAVPSARLLCEAMSRPAMADGAQLVVGNPTGDLQGAGVEARAVTAAFYPSATYLGEDGSAAAVLERLGTGAPPLSLLHLACHGHADPTAPGRSHLRLADRAVGIDEVLALRPTAPLDVGTVCLAACSTNVPGADYDEAFSLAAAFLAAGARTVFASMWPVPDDHTSRLMFMVHHYLAAEGCSPAEALHRARRWALDAHRVAPDSMPPALMAGIDGAEDMVAWAGFQHLGA